MDGKLGGVDEARNEAEEEEEEDLGKGGTGIYGNPVVNGIEWLLSLIECHRDERRSRELNGTKESADTGETKRHELCSLGQLRPLDQTENSFL